MPIFLSGFVVNLATAIGIPFLKPSMFFLHIKHYEDIDLEVCTVHCGMPKPCPGSQWEGIVVTILWVGTLKLTFNIHWVISSDLAGPQNLYTSLKSTPAIWVFP